MSDTLRNPNKFGASSKLFNWPQSFWNYYVSHNVQISSIQTKNHKCSYFNENNVSLKVQEIGSTVVKNSKKIVRCLEVIQRLKSSINEHEIWVNTKIIFNVLVFVKSLAQKCGRKVKKSLVQLASEQFPNRTSKLSKSEFWEK